MYSLLLVLSFARSSLAKSLWSTNPASNFSEIIKTAYPVGNGRLAALPFGSPGHEKLSLNRDNLWSGGPFENASYDGGNPSQPVYGALPGIRDWIWENGTGNVTELMVPFPNYGSYAVLGNLSIEIQGIDSISGYRRALDLKSGVHATTFTSGSAAYQISTYCSYPDDVCVYDISSSQPLPNVRVSYENVQSNGSLVSASCSTGQARLRGITRANIGMKYDSIARVVRDQRSTCDGSTLTVSASGQQYLTLVIAAGTDYDETYGTADHDYSFRGADPAAYVQQAVDNASRKSSRELLATHTSDYSALADIFTLELPDTQGSARMQTSELVARYKANDTAGDPFLESLTFDLGRHLFISSSRDNALPPNLQGKWAYSLSNAWGADYHANINLQMNHWPADQTGLGNLQAALWDYMAETWAPRGAETAKLLYNAPGWVTHDEMNIFGHTGMKLGDAIWAVSPGSFWGDCTH